MFAFVFERALFKLNAPNPAFAPLFQLPPRFNIRSPALYQGSFYIEIWYNCTIRHKNYVTQFIFRDFSHYITNFFTYRLSFSLNKLIEVIRSCNVLNNTTKFSQTLPYISNSFFKEPKSKIK